MNDAPAPAKGTLDQLRDLLRHRTVGAALLSGAGLEIGAFHFPLVLNRDAHADYLDVDDAETLRTRFPELNGDALVMPRWIGDIVRATIPAITGRRFDFIVMNHVLEHVANPIQAIANVWDGLADDGLLAISVPDKLFTFDRARPLTTFAHLLAEYYAGVAVVDDGHYVDFLESAAPEVFADRARFAVALQQAALRREHAHVWDSDSFRAFWSETKRVLQLEAQLLYESTAAANRFEYFAVVRKSASAESREGDALRILRGLHRGRPDLQEAFAEVSLTHEHDLLVWATTAGVTLDSDADALRPFQAHYRRLLQQHAPATGAADPPWRAQR
jgi:SAM-dependent methyltransferase